MVKILIVGGGFSGVVLARFLSKQSSDEIVLMDSKESFVNKMCLIPSLGMKNNMLKENTISYERIFLDTRVKFIKANIKAVNLHERRVSTREGNVFEYDYITICTGMSSNVNEGDEISFAIDKLSIDNMDEVNSMIKSSPLIKVIGGGPTGLEVATSLADHFKKKKIELVHSGNSLVEEFPKQVQQSVMDIVKHFPNLSIQLNHEWKSDEEVDREECSIIKCSSFKPNSNFMIENHSELLDSEGFIKVDSSCRINGFENAFAIGDVSNICKRDFKLVSNAIEQAKHTGLQIIGRDSSTICEEWDTCLILGKFFVSLVPNIGHDVHLESFHSRKKAQAEDYSILLGI